MAKDLDVTIPYTTLSEVHEAENKVSTLRKKAEQYRADITFCRNITLRFGATVQGRSDQPHADSTIRAGATTGTPVTCSQVRQAVNVADRWQPKVRHSQNKLSRLRCYRSLQSRWHHVLPVAALFFGVAIVLAGLADTLLHGFLVTFLVVAPCVISGCLLWLWRADTSLDREQSIRRELADFRMEARYSAEFAAVLAQQYQDCLRELLPAAETDASKATSVATELRRKYESLEGKFRRLIGEFRRHGQTADQEGPEARFVRLLMLPLLDLLGWEETERRQEYYCQSGRRADIVCFRDGKPRLVVEAKARIHGDEDLEKAREQASGYAHELKCSRFAVAAPEGVWVYDASGNHYFLVQNIKVEELRDGDVRSALGKLQGTVARDANFR